MSALKKLNKGDRIPAEDYEVIRKKVSEPEVIDLATMRGIPLYGESTLAVPVYSLLEVYDSSSLATDEVPVVKVRKPLSGARRLATNLEFVIDATKSGAIELITDKPVKIDVDPSDSGFIVGGTCGLSDGTYQVSSGSDGLICLSNPITYQSSKKYIWCCTDMLTGVKGRLFKTPSGGIPAASGSGPYTFGTAACTPVSLSGVVGSGTVTITNIVNQAIAEFVVIKASPVDDGWVVDVASCGS